MPGSPRHLLARDAAGEGEDGDRVAHPVAADAARAEHAVGERDLGAVHVEMAGRHRQVLRLDLGAAGEMHAGEALLQLDQVALVGEGAGPAAAVEIGDVGRAADRVDVDPVAAEMRLRSGLRACSVNSAGALAT